MTFMTQHFIEVEFGVNTRPDSKVGDNFERGIPVCHHRARGAILGCRARRIRCPAGARGRRAQTIWPGRILDRGRYRHAGGAKGREVFCMARPLPARDFGNVLAAYEKFKRELEEILGGESVSLKTEG